MPKKWIAVLAVSLLLIAAVATTVWAQGTTPTTPSTPAPKAKAFGGFWGMRGGWDDYDAMAKALNLTPTQLFEQLHSGKTLDEIATAQGVDLQKVQDAMKATRLDAMKKSIEDAVTAGKLTREQADWMLKGLENGWGFGGFGGRGGHGMRGHGMEFQNKSGTGGTSMPAAPQGSRWG